MDAKKHIILGGVGGWMGRWVDGSERGKNGMRKFCSEGKKGEAGGEESDKMTPFVSAPRLYQPTRPMKPGRARTRFYRIFKIVIVDNFSTES